MGAAAPRPRPGVEPRRPSVGAGRPRRRRRARAGTIASRWSVSTASARRRPRPRPSAASSTSRVDVPVGLGDERLLGQLAELEASSVAVNRAAGRRPAPGGRAAGDEPVARPTGSSVMPSSLVAGADALDELVRVRRDGPGARARPGAPCGTRRPAASPGRRRASAGRRGRGARRSRRRRRRPRRAACRPPAAPRGAAGTNASPAAVERDAAADAVEQLDAELALEDGDGVGQRRLGHEARRGGGGEGAVVDDGEDVAQLVELHR